MSISDVAGLQIVKGFLKPICCCLQYFRLYLVKNITPDYALNKPITADSIEGTGYEASKANDGSDSTRWASAANSTYPHWLSVDMGSNTTINRVKVNWEAAYANDYTIQVSTDNTNWTTVATITGNASAGWKTHDFTSTSARYVKVNATSSSQAASNVSIWTLNVYNTTDYAINKTITADTTEGTGYEASKANDGSDSTRWASAANSTYPHWLSADMGSNTTINRVMVNWEAAYANDYTIQVSTDNTNWTTVATITGNTSAGWKTHDFTSTSARYVKVNVTSSSQAASNVSIWTLKVLGE